MSEILEDIIEAFPGFLTDEDVNGGDLVDFVAGMIDAYEQNRPKPPAVLNRYAVWITLVETYDAPNRDGAFDLAMEALNGRDGMEISSHEIIVQDRPPDLPHEKDCLVWDDADADCNCRANTASQLPRARQPTLTR